MKRLAGRTAAGAMGAWLLVLAATTGAARAQAAGDMYQQLPKVDFGESENELKAFQKEIAEAKPDQYPAIERKLLAVLEVKDAKLAGQQFAFQMLRIVGSPQCVPAVARFLTDEKLSHMARYALYGIKDPSADAALREAAGKTTGKLRIGIINSLGDRRDGGAVPVLSKLMGADDQTTVAAIRAIGRIGTPEAASILGEAKVADSLAWAVNDARLQCAKGLALDGKNDAARAVYEALFKSNAPPLVRAAALTGIARLDGAKALPMILEAIKSEDKPTRQGAGAAIILLTDPGVNYAIARELPKLPSQAKVALLNVLVARGQRNGLTEAVNALVSDESAEVRTTAIASLKTLGDATSVPVLTGVLKNKDLNRDAVAALKAIWADGVAAELIKKAQDGDPDVRAAVIEVLGDRRESAALPMILQCARADDKTIRFAAIKALGPLGGPGEVEAMVQMLVKSSDNGERDALSQAIQTAAKRNENVEGRVEPLIQAMPNAQPDAQVQLIGALKALGGKNALAAVEKCLASGSPEVKKAALRGLSEWVDDAPMNALKNMSRIAADEADRIMALRGFIRMIGLPKNRKAAEAVALYEEAIQLAARPQEKIQAIGGLGNVKDIKSIKALYTHFGDPALKLEAMNAAVKVADQIGKKQNAAEIHPVLEQVIQEAGNEGLKNRARSAMEKLSK